MGGESSQQRENLTPSVLREAIDRKVSAVDGRSLERFLTDLRDRGRSFSDIAFEVRLMTNRSVSHETLRRWAGEWGIE